jgi:hypothetical protein
MDKQVYKQTGWRMIMHVDIDRLLEGRRKGRCMGSLGRRAVFI